MRIGSLLIALTLAACASAPTSPDAQREPVSLEPVIELPAPPRAALEEIGGEQMACYAMPEAEQLADRLDAGQALAEQAAHLRDTAVALDAEAAEQLAATNACRQVAADQAADAAVEVWLWRVVSGVLSMVLLGVVL